MTAVLCPKQNKVDKLSLLEHEYLYSIQAFFLLTRGRSFYKDQVNFSLCSIFKALHLKQLGNLNFESAEQLMNAERWISAWHFQLGRERKRKLCFKILP